jgi:hypothetical protein
MTDIQFRDVPLPGNRKYPQLLTRIKREQLASIDNRELWAYLNEFESEGTARDLAYRLGKTHSEFEFISRKGEGTTVVYARLKDEVTE